MHPHRSCLSSAAWRLNFAGLSYTSGCITLPEHQFGAVWRHKLSEKFLQTHWHLRGSQAGGLPSCRDPRECLSCSAQLFLSASGTEREGEDRSAGSPRLQPRKESRVALVLWHGKKTRLHHSFACFLPSFWAVVDFGIFLWVLWVLRFLPN